MGIAAAAVHTLDPHELCCVMPAHAQTADKELFELKKIGDGVYAAIAAPRYKTNCQYRDRVGVNVEMVLKKVVRKA